MTYEEIFKSRFGNPTKSRGDDLFFKCPECSKKGLSCSLSKGVFHCLNCHFKGSVGNGEPIVQKQKVIDTNIQLRILVDLINLLPLSPIHQKELLTRGLSVPQKYNLKSTIINPIGLIPNYSGQELLDSGLFEFTEYGVEPTSCLRYGRILIPYLHAGKLLGIKTRSDRLNTSDIIPKYLNSQGNNLGSFLWSIEVPHTPFVLVVTEGEFKAMALLDNDYYGTSIPGISTMEKILPQIIEIAKNPLCLRSFCILDSDTNYKEKAALIHSATLFSKNVPNSCSLFLPGDREKIAVDEFLLLNGRDHLDYYLEEAWRRRNGLPVFL